MNSYIAKLFHSFVVPIAFVLFTFSFTSARATQLAGGNFEYNCIGPNTFEVSLRLFQNCGSAVNLPNNIVVDFTSPCGGNFTENFNLDLNATAEISQICPAELANTTCNGGSLPGFEEYIYNATVNLPLNCDSWTMNYELCCRNASNNIANPQTSDFAVSATLNNEDFNCPDINSPSFNSPGVSYICLDEQVNFNLAPIDSGEDSLVYELVAPASTTWEPGFNALQPFGAGVPVTFDPFTGQISFTPDAAMTLGSATWDIAVRVCKVRNNDTVGCLTRDFQFIVENCNNSAPYLETPGFTNVSPGVTVLDSTSLRICDQNLNTLDFDIVFGDTLVPGQLQGNQITITSTVDQVFPNANITITNGNPATINVSQNTPIQTSGVRYFTVQVEDDACPIPGINTYVFSVEILSGVELSINDTGFCDEADSTFVTATSDSPFSWSVISGDPINLGINFSDTNITGQQTVWALPSQTTVYEVSTVSGGGLCNTSDTLTISVFDSIPFELAFTDTLVCPNDTLPFDLSNPGYVEYYWFSTADSTPTNNLFVTEHPYVAIDSNGCEVTGMISVLDLNLPPLLSNFSEVCPNDSSTLTAAFGYDTYTWSNGDTTNPAVVFGPGPYSVTATDTLGCVYEASTDAVPFAVTPVDLGGDDSLCLGQTKLLNAGTGYSVYDWDDTTSNPVRIVDSTGTYSVVVTDVNGCKTGDTVDIFFSPGPEFSLGNDTSLCPGDEILLEAPLGFEPYLWSTGDSTRGIFASDSTFWAEATDELGCTSRDTIELTVRTPPTVDLGPDYNYCRFTTFSEILNPGPQYDAYLWHNGDTTQIINYTEADSTVWVRVFDAFGCEASDTIEVIEDPLPNVNLGGLDTICAGATRPLNAGTSGGTIVSYSWSTNATSQTINITTSQTIEIPDVQNYTVTVTDLNGCERADTFTLVTMPLPSPELGNDTAFCTGDSFSLILDPGNFETYNWNTGSNQPSITVGPVDSLYSVQVTDSIGCVSSADIVVTENPLPNPVLPPDTSICERNPFNIVLNPGGFSSYAWSTGSVAPALLVTTGGTYEVTVTDVNGCQQDTSTTISIEPTPEPDLGRDIVVCEDSIFNITLDGTPSVTGPNYAFAWNNGASTDSISVNTPGRYTVTVTDQGNGCRDSSSVRINIFERVTPNLGPGGVICDGEARLLDPMVSGTGYSFSWNTGESTRRILINQPGTYIVEMNAVNGTCRNNRDTIVFEQGTLPVVELGEDIRACEGQTVRLLDNHTPFPDAEYLWQDTITTPRLSVTRSGRYQVRVTNTCGTVTDEIQVLFDDCYQLYIPNAFTPNGDGINDVFKPETDQPVVDYAMVIYNRWGNAVFKTNDINVGWDGTRNGGALPQDVYIYRITYVSGLDERRQRRIEKGQVTLIKGETIER